jgi:ferrous iron transport protein A
MTVMEIALDTQATVDIPLPEAPLGVPLKVVGVTGGCCNKCRLSSLGIIPGDRITIIHKTRNGPILLDVKGTRVALGKSIAIQVIVRQ